MPRRKWDSNLIARTIRQYHRQGRDISYNAMAKVDQGLISAANQYYGSYREAVLATGIDYAAIRRKPRWTRDRIAELIRQAHRAGRDLSWGKVCTSKDELGRAAKAAIRQRLFGTWSAALKYAGLDPDEVSRYRHWSRQGIKKELRSRRRRKKPLNSKVIQLELPGLYGAAKRYFGNYDAALRYSGIEPDQITQRRGWDRATVRARLREFEHRFGLVSQVMLRRFDTGLLRAIRIWYGDLKSAIKATDIRSYSIQGRRTRLKGKRSSKPIVSWRRRRITGQ